MNHPDQELDAYLDGELSAMEAGEIDAHLAQCPDCARRQQERLALRSAIKAALPAWEAPATLQQRVRHRLQEARKQEVRPRPRQTAAWRWMGLAASLVLATVAGWRVGTQRATARGVADEVLRSHIRSLMPGHLTDVQSSDQHTVKPWFNGLLDYSPPVYDFSGRDFPLLGGRLEYVSDRPVAALVYGRRKHLITVMVLPQGRDARALSPVQSRQGYHLLHWTNSSFAYWVVSDLGVTELGQFAELIKQADSTASLGTYQ